MTNDIKRWSKAQQLRLQIEKQVLDNYFPNFKWINPSDANKTTVEGYLRANTKMFYKIRIYIPADFPNSLPDLVVMENLVGFKGKNMKKGSAAMHIYNPRDGYIKICYDKSEAWTPNKSIYSIVIKGRIWLEAFEAHKKSGNDIDYYLKHK
jgi:ubiquitin-protein ligase